MPSANHTDRSTQKTYEFGVSQRKLLEDCRSVGQGVKVCRLTLQPSSLASVKANHWKIAVGQGVKECRLLTSLTPHVLQATPISEAPYLELEL